MDKKEFLAVIRKYLSGNASEEERQLVDSYYHLFNLKKEVGKGDLNEALEKEILENIWSKVERDNEEKESGKPVTFIYLRRIAAAVIVLIALGVALFTLNKTLNFSDSKKIVSVVMDSSNITPASPTAVLTLSNGGQVKLGLGRSVALKGIATQDSGQLIYRENSREANEVAYNTLSTPRGGTYTIVLSDGTKVWLNAGSSLTYPVNFVGDARTVSLKGEAYFEVAQQANHPFKVEVRESEIQVLGTHFNVRSYQGEKLKTTLTEGLVRVVKGNKKQLLAPGEQAIVEGDKILMRMANLNKVLAWKKDLFYFDRTNIKKIMNELSRWYDVDVAYERDSLKELNFSGVMSRYSEIEDVLKRLSLTGTVHFKIEDREIKVIE